MPTLGEILVRFGADIAPLSAGIAKAAGESKGFGASVSDGLSGAGTAVIVAGLAVAGVSIKMAGDFQESMTSLVTGAGESQSAIDMVSQGILAMAPAVGTSTTDLAAGMYMIESAGYHGAAGLNVLRV